MTSYGYTIMIIVDSCTIWFNCDCIMQLKKSYFIATDVCSRKSATAFGDLPDWWAIFQAISRVPDSREISCHLTGHLE